MDTGAGFGAGPLIVIVGETASGKSALALELAKRFDGEIICADSRTVYKGMDIGTAKPTAVERAEVPHYLLDVAEPNQSFTAADFKRLAVQAIQAITAKGKVPIMVGGTGLYIDAVLFDYAFSSATAKRNPQNPRHLAPDEPRKKSTLRPHTLMLGLSLERSELQGRVQARVEALVKAGFVNEVRSLFDHYGQDMPALQATSYKAFREYIAGRMSLDEAKALFVQNDMQLAKRQRAWFKRNPSIQWVSNSSEAVDIATTFLSKRP